ncbi:MAG: hypothetical protein IPG07_14570 [Crocinitomicaceae bacterium]|nr:hypothetical protein [Crocinitomicaceae bacterium]
MKRLLLLFCLVTLSQITFSQDDDGDGISNSLESSFGLDPNDCDTDDDGLNDYEDYFDFNCDPLSADTDGDGVQDGTEAGITFGCADTDLGIFIPDAEPWTTTDPNNVDSDFDGLLDGDEDVNHNGSDDGGTETNAAYMDSDLDGLLDGQDFYLFN